MKKLEIRPLTGLRAVAAIYVFLFHMQIRWPFVHTSFFAKLVGQGAVGMSVFFVLSGFVLTYQYAGQQVSYREYLVNRLARVYPIYALAALLSLPWIGINFELPRSIGQLMALVVANILVIQAWFPQFFGLWNDSASWSISVEAFCYALLPILLVRMQRATDRQVLMIAFAAYAASVLPGLSYVLFDSAPTVFYSVPIYRLPEFVIGICTCVVFQRGRFRIPPAGIVALAVIAVAYLGTIDDPRPIYVSHNWLIVPAVAASLAALSSGRGALNRIMGSAAVVWLGKISYCIYSLQVLIIFPLLHHHDKIVEVIPALRDNRILMGGALLMLIVASAVAHHAIEEPTRRWIKQRWSVNSKAKTSRVLSNSA
ncbi:acyltransferase [Burkholderia sp. R-69980]|nr:acyltransferase [Burkholderia sp. R-69980]